MDNDTKQKLCEAVSEIYQNLDKQLEASGPSCKACGQCCDFDTFGHRLYVTTPELLYFETRLAESHIPILLMADGICPYRKDGKCSVYLWRFSGCRIFNCTGDADLQSRLSEESIALFKTLCVLYRLEYRYLDLKSGLENIQ